MVIFHLSGSLLSSGICPLLRTKNFGVGRRLVVQQMLRRFGDQRTVAEQHELLVLAGEFQILRTLRRSRSDGRRRGSRRALRQRRGNEPARHVGRERNGAADRSPHGGKARAAEEAAPVDLGLAAEDHGSRRAPGPARTALRPIARLCRGFCSDISRLWPLYRSRPWPKPRRAVPGIQDRECFRGMGTGERKYQPGVFLWCGAKAVCKLTAFDYESRTNMRLMAVAVAAAFAVGAMSAASAAPPKKRVVPVQALGPGTTYIQHTDETGPHPHQDPGAEALLSRRRHRGDAGRHPDQPDQSDRQLLVSTRRGLRSRTTSVWPSRPIPDPFYLPGKNNPFFN